MKKNIAKTVGMVLACGFAAVMAIGETLGNIKNEEKMENFESRLAALESNEEES